MCLCFVSRGELRLNQPEVVPMRRGGVQRARAKSRSPPPATTPPAKPATGALNGTDTTSVEAAQQRHRRKGQRSRRGRRTADSDADDDAAAVSDASESGSGEEPDFSGESEADEGVG